MNLSEHFTLAEFVRSDAARRHGIDNSLPDTLVDNARKTCLMLERIRAHLSRLAGVEVPILITSGFRCETLNVLIGGSVTSEHTLALAADWTAPAFGSPYRVCRELADRVDELGIGQLINEFPGPDGEGWIHTGVVRPLKLANRVITIDRNLAGKVETRVGVLESFA